ncbi:MAG: NAD(P)H-dependent oxidoreductase [Planctomycetes bacterium]|nr:NAD(P)H-dependent oxidoreductase [Planctomycetota bacterium]
MTEAPDVLVLLSHPALQKSRANARLLAAAQGVDGVTVRDLYECYPDFHVDATAEQELLARHAAVVFQHPFYWYSCPALLKQWLDLVLDYGWAYGPGGTALHGKLALVAVTTGGDAAAYRSDGHNRFTMTELLRPLEQTTHLCGMRWLPPFVVHGALRRPAAELDALATDYAALLTALRDGRLDPARFAGAPSIDAPGWRALWRTADSTSEVHRAR